MQPDKTASTYEEMRTKKRFDVKLKAVGKFVGYEKNKYQFTISDLSAHGARLHFETTLDVKIGMSLALIFFIPNTILTIPNTAEIMGVTRKGDVVSVGVKFQDILSEVMMNSLTGAAATI
jgi:hypothetical protein